MNQNQCYQYLIPRPLFFQFRMPTFLYCFSADTRLFDVLYCSIEDSNWLESINENSVMRFQPTFIFYGAAHWGNTDTLKYLQSKFSTALNMRQYHLVLVCNPNYQFFYYILLVKEICYFLRSLINATFSHQLTW